MSVSDLTNTTWVFNNYINVYEFYFQINFTSNENNYTSIVGNDIKQRVKYDDTTAYASDTWSYEEFKTIEITGGTDATNSTLISWLESNATQQESGGGDTSNSNGKIGNLSIIKKHFGDLEIIKEVLNGATIYSNGDTPTPPTPPTPTYPSKSDLITMNIDGTNRKFRVLKNVSGTTYEVLGLFYTSSSSRFGTSNTYNGSNVDTALNSTFYNTLTQTAKSAIVDKSIQQDSLYTTTSTSASGYKAKYGSWSSSSDPTTPNNYIISTGWLANVGTRHIYALGVQDIIDYLGVTTSMTFNNTTLNYENIWKMFDTTRDGGNSMPAVWLRAGYGTTGQTQGMVGFLRIGSGRLDTNRNDMMHGCPYPVFQIDLSKISFTKN